MNIEAAVQFRDAVAESLAGLPCFVRPIDVDARNRSLLSHVDIKWQYRVVIDQRNVPVALIRVEYSDGTIGLLPIDALWNDSPLPLRVELPVPEFPCAVMTARSNFFAAHATGSCLIMDDAYMGTSIALLSKGVRDITTIEMNATTALMHACSGLVRNVIHGELFGGSKRRAIHQRLLDSYLSRYSVQPTSVYLDYYCTMSASMRTRIRVFLCTHKTIRIFGITLCRRNAEVPPDVFYSDMNTYTTFEHIKTFTVRNMVTYFFRRKA